MAALERLTAAMGVVGTALGGVTGAFEQQVRDTGERRGDDDQRSAMRGDQVYRTLDGGCVRKRRAAELPDLQGLCSHDSATLLNAKDAI